MKLYIDTNIYLSYVSQTSDIKSLKKLKKLIKSKKVELVLTSQTKNEYLKHFKDRVTQTKEKLEKAKTQIDIPNELKSEKGKKTKEEKSIIKKIDSLNFDIKKYRIGKIDNFKKHIELVEKELDEIFNCATFFEYSDEIILKAVVRYAKDLPPKKNDWKFGDAIIWETLKHNIQKEELVIVSFDSDFGENKESKAVNFILKDEWKKHTGKKITLYPVLGSFINIIEVKDPVSNEVIKNETKQIENIVYPMYMGKSRLLKTQLSGDGVIFNSPITELNHFGTLKSNQNIAIGTVTSSGALFSDENNLSSGILNLNDKSKALSGLYSSKITPDIYSTDIICRRCGKRYTPSLTGININNLCNDCNPFENNGSLHLYELK